MRKTILMAAVLALFLVALPMASEGATPPEQVTIEGPAFFAGSDAGTGSFTATGPAVDSGTMCLSGSIVDVYVTAAPNNGQPNVINLRILKEFTCDDGSGTFQVKMRVHITDYPVFNWVIKGGTGAYEDLKGNGHGLGAYPLGDTGVWDVYEGKLH